MRSIVTACSRNIARLILPAALGVLTCVAAGGQCLQNHYVSDGATSSELDCQPLTVLAMVAPDQMTSAARDLVNSRHADLLSAARFYGYDIDSTGWSYRQAISPILQKHVVLSFTFASPPREASHFVAVVPMAPQEKVQVVPAFSRGLRLFDPGWQQKGTYSVFNRLVESERGSQPISRNSDWIEFGSLYLALAGGAPAVPTDTDSVKATWDLTVKHATTPVIVVKPDGAATIALSDLSDPSVTTSWKLVFDRHAHIEKASRQAFAPRKVVTFATQTEPADAALPPSALNP